MFFFSVCNRQTSSDMEIDTNRQIDNQRHQRVNKNGEKSGAAAERSGKAKRGGRRGGGEANEERSRLSIRRKSR